MPIIYWRDSINTGTHGFITLIFTIFYDFLPFLSYAFFRCAAFLLFFCRYPINSKYVLVLF